MKANELRIGNLIWENYGGIYMVREIREKEVIISKTKTTIAVGYKYSEVKVIELTEEWLLKFGFEKCLNQYKKLTETQPFIILFLEEQFQYDDLRYRTNLKYVHQLQNLYFSLTGKELTL